MLASPWVCCCQTMLLLGLCACCSFQPPVRGACCWPGCTHQQTRSLIGLVCQLYRHIFCWSYLAIVTLDFLLFFSCLSHLLSSCCFSGGVRHQVRSVSGRHPWWRPRNGLQHGSQPGGNQPGAASQAARSQPAAKPATASGRQAWSDQLASGGAALQGCFGVAACPFPVGPNFRTVIFGHL